MNHWTYRAFCRAVQSCPHGVTGERDDLRFAWILQHGPNPEAREPIYDESLRIPEHEWWRLAKWLRRACLYEQSLLQRF